MGNSDELFPEELWRLECLQFVGEIELKQDDQVGRGCSNGLESMSSLGNSSEDSFSSLLTEKMNV